MTTRDDYYVIRVRTCGECSGYGERPGSLGKPCRKCEGEGRIREEVPLEDALAAVLDRQVGGIR